MNIEEIKNYMSEKDFARLSDYEKKLLEQKITWEPGSIYNIRYSKAGNLVCEKEDGKIICIHKPDKRNIPKIQQKIDIINDRLSEIFPDILSLIKDSAPDHDLCSQIKKIFITRSGIYHKYENASMNISFSENENFSFRCKIELKAMDVFFLSQEKTEMKEMTEYCAKLIIDNVTANTMVDDFSPMFINMLCKKIREAFRADKVSMDIVDILDEYSIVEKAISSDMKNTLKGTKSLHTRNRKVSENGVSLSVCGYNIFSDFSGKNIKINNSLKNTVKNALTADKEVRKIEEVASKYNISFTIKKVLIKCVRASIYSKEKPSVSETIEIARPVYKKNFEKEFRDISRRINNEVDAILKKEQQELQDFIDSPLAGDLCARKVADIIDKNSYITENTIIEIMRNLSIKSNYYYVFSERDRMYSYVTPEYISDIITKMRKMNILQYQSVKGTYGWYERVVKGKKYNVYVKAITRKKSGDGKSDIDVRCQIHDKKGDISFLPTLLEHPAVLSVHAAIVEKYLESLDRDILDMYIKSKKKAAATKEEKYALKCVSDILKGEG